MTVGIPFGNYHLIRRLARGGMAEVFLATQSGPEGFERTVAVKRILPHLADSPQFVEMFMDEARLAAQLSHPNIAHIYEFGRVEDSYFIAMEYIDGIDLSAVVLDGMKQPIPIEHAARIIADVCAALHCAHSLAGKDGRPLNLVHRDISPQNILVSFSGAVKVVDFGIAKAAIHIERTRPGVVRGKYTYMSPEQVEGKPLDGRTDLFCAGIVLYELCTADALFPRNDPIQAMRRIRSCDIPKPTRAGQPLPPKLEEILMRSMARRKEDRFRNAVEMQMELEEFLRHAAQISNSIVVGEYFTKFYRRFRPTPEQARSSAELRSRTLGVQGKATPGLVKGTAPVGSRPLSVELLDDYETLIVDDPSAANPVEHTVLHPPMPPIPASALHRIETVIKASDLQRREALLDDSQVAEGPLADDPPTRAFTSRPQPAQPPSAAVGGEIDVSSNAVLLPRQATPPGVTIDPMIAGASTIIEPSDTDDTRTLPPERAAVQARLALASRTLRLKPVGKGLLVLAMIALVGVAGVLTGHWLSRLPDGADAAAPEVDQRVWPDTSQPPDQPAPAREDGRTAPAVGQSTLTIRTDPEGASVTIDGAEIPGTTPLSHPLYSGSHVVVASYPGFENHSRTVRLEPGQELTVQLLLRRLPPEQVVSLKRHTNQKKRVKRLPPPKVAKKAVEAVEAAKGLLSISTIPWSTVFLGNRKLGITPLANVSVPVGTHTLRFVDEGGRSYTRKVTVTAERVAKLSFRLPPK